MHETGKADMGRVQLKIHMPGSLKSILSCIRYSDALIFQTPAILGLAMFLPGITPGYVVDALLASLGSFLVAACILAINDWADINLDSQNRLKHKDTFLKRGLHPRQVLTLVVSLAAAGIGLLMALSPSHVVTALLAILLGIAYSVPLWGMRGKSTPIISSFLHFGGTVLAFLLGALTFMPVDSRGLLVACYPAILIAAGHLAQEVEDHDEDRISECRTNAVRFGRKPVFLVSLILFGLSFLLLYWLAAKGIFPGAIRYTAILYPVLLMLAAQAYRSGLTRDSVRQLRNQYRILFAVIMLAILAGSLLGNRVI